ncbi:uncharacterized protein STAUR_0055 [Stigmatella aurantiaca DW4/3-1]|uniref:Uncharacterized protein n=1 Tax=Stigmatella aurantiaca (strain DW4/3-1) TaxID=378806 RepID=E3FIW4_STIAD|nr:uncharacterized protein STAUR_0055 [Stigmatella aurantiaca DW4/3-1]
MGLLAIPAFLGRRRLGGAISSVLIAGALGVLGVRLRGLARTKEERPSVDRWKLPPVHPVMSEEFAASAASGR